MRLELSRRAQVDLDDVRDYSVAEFGNAGAAAYLDAIEASFRRMLDFPCIGSVHATLRPPTRSLGCQQHRIFYQVEGEMILVLRILHKARDAERRL